MQIRYIFRFLFFGATFAATGCSFDAGERPTPVLSGPADAALDATVISDAATPPDASPADGGSSSTADAERDTSHDSGPDTSHDASDARLDDARTSDAEHDASQDAGDAASLTNCEGVWVDLQTDPDHCGECANACDPSFGTCAGGVCGCSEGLEACTDEARCFDTTSDPNHCGACGVACGVGEYCVQGSCECRPGLTRCDGVCVDTSSHPNHCGSCGASCGQDACFDGTCQNNCVSIGNGVALQCDDPGGGTHCVRDSEHDLYCGARAFDACGTECEADELCLDPGVFARPRCVAYRPGRGCTECPCEDCDADEVCVVSQEFSGRVLCVR